MPTLYAAKAQSLATSDLYTVDPATGIVTSIGPIGYAVTGLAFDPTDGTLYGITSRNSSAHPLSIITIDPATGAGTFVASTQPITNDNATTSISDIAINSAGQMYGMSAGRGGLVQINKATGASTRLTSAPFSPSGGGIDFDLGDVCWNVDTDGTINTFDMVGVWTYLSSLPFANPTDPGNGKPNALSIAAGLFWLASNFAPIATLYTIDPASFATDPCTATRIGDLGSGFDAVAWDDKAGGSITADFTATPVSGHAPLTVAFTDLSAGGATAWAWNFGDGHTSTDQNPTHTYDAPGNYDVTLTAT